MRVVCLYREREDYTRVMEEWLADYQHFGGEEIEILDPDSVEGQSFVEARGLILKYPYLAAIDMDGRVVFESDGLPLPRFDTVRYYQLQG